MVTPSTSTDGSIGVSYRRKAEYEHVKELPPVLAAKQAAQQASAASVLRSNPRSKPKPKPPETRAEHQCRSSSDQHPEQPAAQVWQEAPRISQRTLSNQATTSRVARAVETDARVISGHLGWVRALAVEPNNQWFASGAGDRTIKIWNMATGNLRLTLTGHISTVRGLAVSPRHPYLFSCGEDKMVKCWDLETNKVIRHYHGHLSGVYTLALHPNLDLLVTGGRDGVCRVWDMRTRSNVHVLAGHKGSGPAVISGSLDATVRLWDLAAGKSMGVLTHHKKGVRALATHPTEFTFASASTGSIKQWKCPEGAFMQNFDGQNAVINSLAVNDENVMFSGGDNGSMGFWDWKTGPSSNLSIPWPSLAGIMASTFDKTGLRLITGEADKAVKVWKQDENATPEAHPVAWAPTLGRTRY
ncbi:Pre-mRNA-splicing factor prp46 [Penicillium manginii]|uniref:Pre-mRNA-splicing factor prp46 n=1 Tax=Penicillium manginii TaxID=203109 RepID=UPI00254800B3|nr:Pre-mRNA-splicing factor prp46 [Penicillium manginii]KAJ5742823.1 Pre-mRNA-splicing factor prp46 [Penicillium manginii]